MSLVGVVISAFSGLWKGLRDRDKKFSNDAKSRGAGNYSSRGSMKSSLQPDNFDAAKSTERFVSAQLRRFVDSPLTVQPVNKNSSVWQQILGSVNANQVDYNYNIVRSNYPDSRVNYWGLLVPVSVCFVTIFLIKKSM